MPPITTEEPVEFTWHAGTEQDPHKVVIVGSGPAACTAAIYTARATLQPLMLEGGLIGSITAGGLLNTTTDVENFPGFPDAVMGPELTDRFRQQAKKQGTKTLEETVVKVDLSKKPFRVWLEGKEEEKDAIYTKTLIVATGATAKTLEFPGSKELWQNGISACTVCDGAAPIFRRKPVALIGGGDSACEESLFMTRFASKVYMIVRRDVLRASKVMQKRVMTHPKIEILWNTQVVEAKGNDKNLLSSLILEDSKTKTKRELECNGLFFAIGHEPNTKFLQGQGLDINEVGYLKVIPGTGTTNVTGVFAAGDVADPVYRQAVTAAGSGCAAALDCIRYLEELEEEA